MTLNKCKHFNFLDRRGHALKEQVKLEQDVAFMNDFPKSSVFENSSSSSGSVIATLVLPTAPSSLISDSLLSSSQTSRQTSSSPLSLSSQSPTTNSESHNDLSHSSTPVSPTVHQSEVTHVNVTLNTINDGIQKLHNRFGMIIFLIYAGNLLFPEPAREGVGGGKPHQSFFIKKFGKIQGNSENFRKIEQNFESFCKFKKKLF